MWRINIHTRKFDYTSKATGRMPEFLCKYIIIKVVVFIVWHKPPQIWNGSWPSSSGLRGRRRTYHTILKLADHALRYILLWPLRPELDSQDPFKICGGLCQTRKTPTLTLSLMACSSSLDDSSPSARHVFVLASKVAVVRESHKLFFESEGKIWMKGLSST
jgi:hypothetical protein